MSASESLTKTSSATRACEPAAEQSVKREIYVRPRYRVDAAEAAYHVEIDVPGVDKPGLEIALDDGVLEIVARRDWTAPDGWRPLGDAAAESYAYRLRLAVGDDVNGEGIEAQLARGVLRLSLPKAEEKRPRRIEVT